MSRRTAIVLASVVFLGAIAASTTAEARMGGFHGGGFHGGDFHGGGFHGGGFHVGFRGGGFHGFRGGFVGPRFAARHHFFHHRFVGFHRFARFHRFHHRRFAFAAVPFVVGAPYYDSCWVVRYTPWGLRRVFVCDY